MAIQVYGKLLHFHLKGSYILIIITIIDILVNN